MGLINKFKRYYYQAYLTSHFPSTREIFFGKKKIFAYYGFLGDNNFGDELVYDSAKLVFEGHLLLPLRRLMPLSLIFFNAFFKSKIDGIIIGGGTLIGPFWEEKYFLSLINLKKPVYVHGTGVHQVIPEADQWKKVLASKFFGGVRGPLSVKNLSLISNSTVIGDAAFAFYTPNLLTVKKNHNDSVLINLGTHFDYEGQDLSRKEFEKFIQYLLNENYNIDFLPFHQNDVAAAKTLMLKFPQINLLKQPTDYFEALQTFKKYSFAFGERLHFTVMAIMSGTAFLSINYAKKHYDLLSSLNLGDFGIDPNKASVENYIESLKSINAFDWEGVNKKLDHYKSLQFDDAKRFVEFAS